MLEKGIKAPDFTLPDKDGNMMPKIKLSDNTAKITNPAFKRLYRLYNKKDGMAVADLITLREETIDENQPLKIFDPVETWKTLVLEDFHVEELQHTIIKGGELVYEFPALVDVRAFSKNQLANFWEEYLRLDVPHVYKVDLSDKLYALKSSMMEQHRLGAKKENVK